MMCGRWEWGPASFPYFTRTCSPTHPHVPSDILKQLRDERPEFPSRGQDEEAKQSGMLIWALVV